MPSPKPQKSTFYESTHFGATGQSAKAYPFTFCFWDSPGVNLVFSPLCPIRPYPLRWLLNRKSESAPSNLMCAIACSKDTQCLFLAMEPIPCVHLSALSIVQDPAPEYASPNMILMKHLASVQNATDETAEVQQVIHSLNS